MDFTELSGSERMIMEVLWAKGEPLSFGELLEYFSFHTETGWKKQTLNTFLYRMRKKSLLQMVDSDKHKKYVPSMSREKYQIMESKILLDKNYQGSIVKMLAAFGGIEKIDREEIEELKKLIKEWEKKQDFS